MRVINLFIIKILIYEIRIYFLRIISSIVMMLISKFAYANIANIVKVSTNEGHFGSGFVIEQEQDHYIVTVAHIINDYKNEFPRIIIHFFDDVSFNIVDFKNAIPIVFDEIRDIMILKIKHNEMEENQSPIDKVKPLKFANHEDFKTDLNNKAHVMGVNIDIVNRLNKISVNFSTMQTPFPSINGFKHNVEFNGAQSGFSGGPIISKDQKVLGIVLQYSLQQIRSKDSSIIYIPTTHGLGVRGDELGEYVKNAINHYHWNKTQLKKDENWYYNGGWSSAFHYDRKNDILTYKGITFGYSDNDKRQGYDKYGFHYSGLKDETHVLNFEIIVKNISDGFIQNTKLSIQPLLWNNLDIIDNSLSVDLIPKYQRKYLVRGQSIVLIAVASNMDGALRGKYKELMASGSEEGLFSHRKYLDKYYFSGEMNNQNYIDFEGIRFFKVSSLRDILQAFIYANENRISEENIYFFKKNNHYSMILETFNKLLDSERKTPFNISWMLPTFSLMANVTDGSNWQLASVYPMNLYLNLYDLISKRFEDFHIKIETYSQDQLNLNKCSILSLIPIFMKMHDYLLNHQKTYDLNIEKVRKIVLNQIPLQKGKFVGKFKIEENKKDEHVLNLNYIYTHGNRDIYNEMIVSENRDGNDDFCTPPRLEMLNKAFDNFFNKK